MKTRMYAALLILTFSSTTFFVIPSLVFAVAGVPKVLNHQGRLMDSAGTLLGGTGTDYCFKFAIYDDTTVGTPDTQLWPSGATSTMTVQVKNGVFNVGVGDTSAGGDTLDYNFQDNDTVYLGVDVASKVGGTCAGGDEVFERLTPRQRVTASGYAVNASTVGGFTPSQTPSGNQIAVLLSGVLSVPTASSTLATTSQLVVSNSFTFKNVTGFLKAVAGVVSTALINLVSDVTGILGVGNGGTGWSNILAGAVLYGNGAGALATTTAGTAGNVLALLNGIPTWTATTTAGTGLSYNGTSFTVNTSQNIATLSNLTTNGFVRTSGGTGTLSVQTDPIGVSLGGTGQISLASSQLMYGAGSGAVQSVATTSLAIGTSLSSSGTLGAQVGGANTTLSLNLGNANSWTALQQFGNASTSIASAHQAFFGATATTTISSIGAITVPTGASVTSPAYTAAAATTLSSGGTSGLTLDSASGDILVSANDAISFAATTLGNNGSRNVTINSGTGGTTATLIVKLDTSGTVVTTDTTTLNNAVGVAINTTTIGQAVRVAINGVVTATADNAVTAGDYIGVGTATAGRAKSLGTAYPSTAGVQVIGRALGTQATPGSTFLLMLNGLDNNVSSGGSGYSLIKDETTGLTARTTLAFLGAGVTCADAGGSQTECTIPGGAGGGVSFASGTADNTTSSNNLIHLTKSGVDVFKVANSGGLSIFAATTDTVKTTTGTTRTQDFSITGSTLQNVTSSSDLISIDNGTMTLEGSIAASSPAVTTAAAMGLGGHVILRDDGKYIIIHGGAATGVSIWDGTTGGAMSAAPTILNTAAGAGAISIKRPDGRYLVVKAGGSAGLTALYDPYGITATAAGAVVCAGGAATTGTGAILLPGGNYLIMCGGLAVTSIYNPTSDVVTVGPPLGTGTFGAGAHALARDDGTFLIFKGGGTGTAIYNPLNSGTGVTTIGTMTDVTITNAPTIAIGATSIRKQDGTYLVIPGAITTSAIYDPKGMTAFPNGTFTTQSGAGNGPSVVLGEGAQAFWRQDGNYILIIGGAGVVTTNVVKPGAAAGSQFVTTNAPAITAGGAGVGVTAFMKPDGRYAILKGNGTAVDYYDMQFVVGGNPTGTGVQSAYWESECIDNTNLNPNSVINWNANAEGKIVIETRTVTSAAACTAGTYATTTTSGDKIRLTAPTDNRIQFRVTFKRDLPKFFDQEWGVRRASQTRYRRTNKDPALYDVGVFNGLALHRTQFDFGDSMATSGPVSINITNSKDKNLGIALEAGIGYGSTVGTVAGSGGIYNGAFNSNSALTTTATNGTIVMKRPDGKFVVISGNTATANAQLYNPDLRTFTALGTTPAAGTGLGALAFKRPDGKFLIVLGNNTNVTSIFDPVANTFTAGPVLTGLAGDGAQVIPLPTGRVLIIHGNYLSTTSIYDPIQNIMIGGPVPSTAVGQGSVVIPRPDGTFLFIPGVVTTGCTALSVVTNNFDPYTMTFNSMNAPTMLGTGPGAFAFQRNDGLWVIVRGGATASTCAALTATTLYNPVENRMAVGPVLSAAAQRGAHAIPRPDGTWLIVHAGTTALNTTSIYREKALGVAGTEVMGQIGVFIAGPTLVTVAGAGSISFQKDNGRFVTITGNAGAVVQEYDGGWVDKGVYKTEQFNLGSQLGTDSTLAWRANTFTGISAEVKTATTQAGLQTASSREVAKSGALINPGGSDTWLQINFNFTRKFPSFDRLYTDTWYNSGASFSYAQRKIETPTLYEYKVTKDKDVIDLQSDGLSVFRVSSSGDVYTQAGGTINTSGADLAERYTSQETLDFGEVVSIDPQNNHGVKKSLYQYQPDVLGVVSTDPGFVAGAYTKDSYPIALIGRVPVKVSTENGMIRSGDSLTAASAPGHAMKAQKAGRVIGKALESLDPEKLVGCPPSEFIIPGRKCGIVMMYVNLFDSMGSPIEVVMAEAGFSLDTPSSAPRLEMAADADVLANSETREVTEEEQANLIAAQSATQATAKRGLILEFLKTLKEQRVSTMLSEVFTDRLSATLEIITPILSSETVYTRSLQVETIEGMATSSLASSTARVVRVRGGLEVEGDTLLGGGLRVDYVGEHGDVVEILADLLFTGRPVFSSDTGGFARIEKDAKSVKILFERPYEEEPVVNVTLTMNEATSTDQVNDDEVANEILKNGISYVVSRKSTKGFALVINKPAPLDLAFSWTALAVRNPRTFMSFPLVVTAVSEQGLVVESLPVGESSTSTPEITTQSDVIPEAIIEAVSSNVPPAAIQSEESPSVIETITPDAISDMAPPEVEPL